ncbi:Fe-S cluster assembly protein SufD [Halobacteriales archaeon QH_10_67_13]|nr:MAG: Fe-S cluster assembly protein SufD [Halobacteriales archaeon QH_10_67_13]
MSQANVDVHETLSPEQVRTISGELGEPEWLLETRLDALEALGELEMPKVIRTPGRDWTDLHGLAFEEFVDPLKGTQQKDRVTAAGAEVLDWETALTEHGDLIETEFGRTVDPERNYLTALSTALFSTGTVVYVPEGVRAEDVTIRTTTNSRSLFNYTLVVAEESASVTILERQDTGDSPGDRQYYSGIVEAIAGENARIQYGTLQQLDEDAYNFQTKVGRAGQYGQVNWIEGTIGSRLNKSTVETHLEGQGAESTIVGAFFGRGDQHFDVASRVWHEAEHTTADLVTRGVLDDQARSVYEGVQDVGSKAWDTNSYQRENTLMLSDESEADASPKLIINNHDTEASHSATVGQVDAEEMLYMTSRAIDPDTATDMLVEGFFVPVMEEIEVKEFREDLEAAITARLG